MSEFIQPCSYLGFSPSPAAMDTEAARLFTESHRDHDERWTVHTSDVDVTCFACLMELLEDQDVLLVKKKFVLSELLRFLSYHTEYLLEVVTEDFRVIVHATAILLGEYNLTWFVGIVYFCEYFRGSDVM